MNLEQVNLVIGVVSFLVGLVLGIWAIKSGWQVARASGAFAKSRLSVMLAGARLGQDETSRLIVGIPFNGENYAIAYLPLLLSNSGERSARNVAVTLRFPKDLRRAVREAMASELSARNQTNKAVVKHARVGEFEFTTYSVDRIDPNTAFQSSEPFVVGESRVRVEAKTRDNVPVAVEATYAFLVQITITGEDQVPIDHTVAIEVFDVSDRDELIANAVERALERRMERRKRMSWFQYLRAAMVADTSSTYQMAFAPMELKTADGTPYLEGTREVLMAGPLVVPDYSIWLLWQ